MIRTVWNFEGLVVAYRVCCLAVLTWTGSCKDNMRRNQRIQNVSQTIEDLLNGYDIRLRPQFGGDPLYIAMELDLASFDSISEVNMDYTITIHLNQYWKDERLAFSHRFADNMTLTGDFAEKIWVPDTFFANDKHSFLHDVTEMNKMVRLHGDGSIVYGMRFTTTLACMMDLHNYPLDEQNCTVEIESYGYPMQDVIMEWKGKEKMAAVHGIDRAEIPQFTVINYETSTTIESLATGKYQRLSLSFKLERNIGYFLFQTYLPSIFIVMLSWVSFWINYEATSARVTLGITTVLTMTTISTGVRSALPRISYVKAIDIYLVMCFVFVFAALLEYAAVNYTFWGARAKRKAKRQQQQQQRQQAHKNKYQIETDEFGQRCSPILGIRNRSYAARTDDVPRGQQPRVQSTRLTTATYSVRVTASHGGLRKSPSSGSAGRQNFQRQAQTTKRKRILAAFRDRAKAISKVLPSVTDVSKIDKYSRLLFPALFAIFNAGYWSFYLLQ